MGGGPAAQVCGGSTNGAGTAAASERTGRGAIRIRARGGRHVRVRARGGDPRVVRRVGKTARGKSFSRTAPPGTRSSIVSRRGGDAARYVHFSHRLRSGELVRTR